MAAGKCIALWMLLALGIATQSACLPDVAGQAPREEAKPDGKAPFKSSGKSSGKSSDKSSAKPSLKPGQIDLEKSRVYVYVGKKGLGHAHAVEGKIKSGSINIKGDKTVGEIVFDMASFSADTDEARQQVELKGTIAETTREQVTETMNGTDVLDVKKFPTATFKFKSADASDRRTGGSSYGLKGDLTLHGKTRPLAFVAEQTRENDRLRFRGDFTILQSDFGITPYKAALGTVGVADQLKIWGDIWIAEPESDKK